MKDTDANTQSWTKAPTTTREAVTEQYRHLASSYESKMVEIGFQTPRQMEGLSVLAFEDKHASILEVGCGTGLVMERLARIGFDNLHGLDLSPDMLAENAKKNVSRSLVEGDNMPFDDNSFDHAYCVAVLTHSDRPSDAIKEIVRVVRPGGFIIIGQRSDLTIKYNLIDFFVLGNYWKDVSLVQRLPYCTASEAYKGLTVDYFILQV